MADLRAAFVETLRRRAETHEDPAVREVLAARLQALDAGLADATVPGLGPGSAIHDATRPRTRGPLADLLATLPAKPLPALRAATTPAASPTTKPAPQAPTAIDETLGFARATWSRLSASRRLTQALAQVPQNAGPLHSGHLMHRALVLMNEVSPAYLERFVAQVDALMWLEEAGTPKR